MATTYGAMFMQTATVAWVAASDGIYKITNGTLAKVCPNASNWAITGICTLGTNLYFCRSGSNLLYYKAIASVTGDVNTFTSFTGAVAGGSLAGLTTDGSKLVTMTAAKQMFTIIGPASPLITVNSTGFSVVVGTIINILTTSSTVIVKTSTNIYYVDLTDINDPFVTDAGSIRTGRLAVNGDSRSFIADNGVYEQASPEIKISNDPIVSIAMIARTGYAVDTAGVVYIITSPSASSLFTTVDYAVFPATTPAYGAMFMESATVGWVAGIAGIYKLENGILTKICTNTSNWRINGICTVGTKLYISRSNAAFLFSYPVASLSGTDVSMFSALSIGSNGMLLGLTASSSLGYYINAAGEINSIAANGSSSIIGSFPATTLNGLCFSNGKLFTSNGTTVYTYDIASNANSTLSVAATGQLAADSSGNLFFANNGVKEYNSSFKINNLNQLNTLSNIPLITIGMFGNAGFAIHTRGTVYTFTSSSTALATGLPLQYPTVASASSIADVATATVSSFPNPALPRWANMVVLGEDAWGKTNLARAIITKAHFDAILASRYGGVRTTAIDSNCQFLSGDRVNVPIRR
jgi:hypothetical protein